MKSPNFIKSISLIILVTIVLSCKQNKEIKLVFPKKVNYESFIIANHLGYFKGFDIKPTTVKSGINAAEAVSLGSADIAAMGDGPTSILMSQDKKISVVARYAKGNKIHRLISDKNIKTPNDLKGKKIGIQVGSSTNAAFLGYLKRNNIKLSEITLVPLSPSNMPEAMKTKQLDAMAGSEPWALNVQNLCKKNVHELANLKNNQNHFPHLLVANNSLIKNNKKAIKHIIKGLRKANQFIKQNPEKAAKIASKYIGLSPKDELICISRLDWTLGWENSDLTSLKQTAGFFHASGKINKIPTIENFINNLTE